MKHLIIPICLALYSSLVFGQEANQFDANGKRHGVWKKYFKDTKVLRYEGQFEHGTEIGEFRFYKNIKGKAVLSATRTFGENYPMAYVKFYASTGKVISEGKMLGKIYIGTWKYYQKNSDKLLTLENFNDKGELDGERIVYYENGQIAEQKFFKNGVQEGKATNYSLRGVVLKSYIYENGELHGPSKYYNPKGELIAEGSYRRGKKHGIWNYYEDGKLVNTKNFTVEGKYKPKKKAP